MVAGTSTLRDPASSRKHLRVPFAPAEGKDGGMAVALRTLRIAAGYSLDDFALATGLNPGYLSRVERGERHLSPAARIKVARVLDLDLATARRIPELAARDDVSASGEAS